MSEQPPRADGEREPSQGPTFVGPRDWPPPEMRWPPRPGDEPPLVAERPAPWQALLLCGSIALAAQLAATLVLKAWTKAGPYAEELSELQGMDLAVRAAALPGGLEAMVLPIQATLAAFALLLAIALPGGVRAGLALERPRVGARQWLLAIGGTLVVQQISTRWVVGWFELPPHLKMLEDGLAQRSALAASLLVVAAPAVCEELFFRGWLQRRLRVAWGSAAAVLLSGAVFALYHLEPIHVLGVLPIGLWIAWSAQRTGSTWVAVACHAANNGLALLTLRLDWP